MCPCHGDDEQSVKRAKLVPNKGCESAGARTSCRPGVENYDDEDGDDDYDYDDDDYVL